jgi:hypothetical protein
VTEAPFSVDGAQLRVSAPTYEAACLLEQQLDGCHTTVVQEGGESWAVTAQPWLADGRSLRATLSAIERWLADIQLTQTHVRVGEHEFTLCAGEPA